MRYSLGIDLGGTTARVSAASDDGRVHDVGEAPLVVGLTPAGEVVVGSGALGLDENRRVSGFRDRLGQPEPMLLGGTPFGVEALIAQVLRSTVDTVASDVGEWPVRIAVAHPDEWGDYHLDLLWQAAAMAEVGDVVLLTESEARSVASDEASTAFTIARGAARWARPEDQTPPVEAAGLPISGRTATSVLAALAGGAALGVAGAAATAGAAGAGTASRIADFGQGGRTMADWARGSNTMADYADSGSRMSDFGEGRSMSDFGGSGSQPPPQPPTAIQTTARAGRRIPKAAVAAAAVVAVAVIAGGIALASRGSDAPDETAVGTETTVPLTTDAPDTTAQADRDTLAEAIPFVFAGSTYNNRAVDPKVGDTIPRTKGYLDGGATGVAVSDDGRVFILDGANFGALWEVDGDDMTLLFKGDANASPNFEFSNSTDLAVRGSGDDVELFIADPNANRIIRYVPATDELETWGTEGTTGDTLLEDGTAASEALFASPVSVDVDDDGNVWAADLNKLAVFRIGTDERVTAVSGRGNAQPTDGAKATDVKFNGLRAIAVDDVGNPVVAAGHELWRINADGTIQKIAGTGEFPSEDIPHGDGGPALRAAVSASDLAFGPGGVLYIAGDGTPGTVRTIDGNGRIDRIAGRDTLGGSTPLTAMRWAPDSIAVGDNGDVFVGETTNGFNVLRRIPSSGVPDDTAAIRFDFADRVGRADDLQRANAAPDHVLELVAEDDVEDVFISIGECSTDDADWDTEIGNEAPGVGVAIGQANIQNDEGTGELATLPISEPTLLTLYFEDDGGVSPGDTLCVTLVGPDGGEDEQRLVIRGFEEVD